MARQTGKLSESEMVRGRVSVVRSFAMSRVQSAAVCRLAEA